MSRKILGAGKYLSLVEVDGYEVVDRINCAGVAVLIAVTDKQELVLVEQFRKPLEKRAIELPAGLVSDTETAEGETIEAAAARELAEETGYEASSLEYVGIWPTSCGMTSETVTVYRAHGLKKTGSGGGDETENITVHVVPIAEAKQWLKAKSDRGLIIDSKVYAAFFLL